jgi:hypothetical protein
MNSVRPLIVTALALSAIPLASSGTVAHAAPGDVGPAPPPLLVHASENPVVIPIGQTEKTITITWTPTEPATMHMENNHGHTTAGAEPVPVPMTVRPEDTPLAVWVELGTGEVSPPLTSTTVQLQGRPGIPLPGINPTLIPLPEHGPGPNED